MRLIDADALNLKLASLDNIARSPSQKALLGRVFYIVDQMPTVGGWISVDNELPDAAGVGVLVNAVNRFGQDSIFIAFQGYGDFKWYTMDATKMAGDKDNSVNVAWKITHWMPILPQKEVKE